MPKTTFHSVDVHFGDCDPAGIVFFLLGGKLNQDGQSGVWGVLKLLVSEVTGEAPERRRLAAARRAKQDKVVPLCEALA